MTLLSILFAMALVVAAGLLMGRRWHSYIVVNPHFADRLQELALTGPEAILELPAVIVSGHPDRNVACIKLGEGDEALRGFLKREHSVRLKERILNAWVGFGFVSKSHREAVTLIHARLAGIPCPEWIAYGQSNHGQAFLIVAALDQSVDLRTWLDKEPAPSQIRALAVHLGRSLAKIHNAGFVQPDLYAKHVLINEVNGGFHFLDWQRSRRFPTVSWNDRFRDLAALHATLPECAAIKRHRLGCLVAYLNETKTQAALPVPDLSTATAAIKQQGVRLMRRRHIRQARQALGSQVPQNVIWLKGEALCIAPELLKQAPYSISNLQVALNDFERMPNGVINREIQLSDGRPANLTTQKRFQTLPILVSKALGKRWIAPEVRQAGLLFRLQRLGIETPRLLAFGQSHGFLGKSHSFLLTDTAKDGPTLSQFLAHVSMTGLDVLEPKTRHALIGALGGFLKRIHEAGCLLKAPIDLGADLVVFLSADLTIGLGRMDNIVVKRCRGRLYERRILNALTECMPSLIASRMDRVRLVRAYFGWTRLNGKGKKLSRLLLRPSRADRLFAFLHRSWAVILRSPIAGPLRVARRASS